MIRVGVEQELIVTHDGIAVDFRGLIRGLKLGGRLLDPIDRNAHRFDDGLVITCDGNEAEVALPPVVVKPGFVRATCDWVGHSTDQLCRATGIGGLELIGASTHISVSVPEHLAVETAGIFCRTFAPAVMLMMDNEDSPGLLVRPRHQRVELGGDFVRGPHLEAAIALSVAGVVLCADVAAGRQSKARLPPPIRLRLSVEAISSLVWSAENPSPPKISASPASSARASAEWNTTSSAPMTKSRARIPMPLV